MEIMNVMWKRKKNVQEVSIYCYSKVLNKMGQDFLDQQYWRQTDILLALLYVPEVFTQDVQ